ncbi:hypothetical protein [Mesorhizobium sophorae]|uniref:hypothetical protein n=1 Tax=Mesorhizobium sophorae TaxID=1300294 RepID=UPI000BA4AA06|nr:hypothetical protein [Mesorhizobium sophorae]
MGQLPHVQHWEALVLRSYRLFAAAEDQLEKSLAGQGDYEFACLEALRSAMNASLFLYHFTDIAAARRLIPHLALPAVPTPQHVLVATRAKVTVALRASAPHTELYNRMLGEAANAIKHGVLDRATTFVDQDGVALTIAGHAAENGEGKTNGGPQVLIRSESRAGRPEQFYSLRAVLDAVINAWCGLLLGLAKP